MQYVNVEDIRPAEYNPRKISKEQFEKLKKSIHNNGFVIPIIVNKRDNTIIAGHQRTRAAVEIGYKKVPAFFCDSINRVDEIKLNQLHNGTDRTINSIAKTTLKDDGFGVHGADEFQIINYDSILVKEICKLILKYGNILCAVIHNEKVLIGANYIQACKLLNEKVNTSTLRDVESDNAALIMENYGEFFYSHLPKNTWIQGLAQMHRTIQKGVVKRQNKSTLYEKVVLPDISTNGNILDFGCGKGTYIKMLQEKGGRKALGVEFYNNNGKYIDAAKGNRQIDKLIDYITESPRGFEYIVCDSVMNSIDCNQAKEAILICCNLFCVKGGILYISGRPIESVIKRENRKRDGSVDDKYIKYLDGDGYTADYRKGQWYYQHFDKKQDIVNTLKQCGFETKKLFWQQYSSTTYQIVAVKNKELSKDEYIKAIDYEFNLPLPNGRRYKRNADVKAVYGF